MARLPKILANGEEHFALKVLARKIHSGISIRTLERWITVGRHARRGDKASPVIRMDFINGPSGRRSSVEAYFRFISNFNVVK